MSPRTKILLLLGIIALAFLQRLAVLTWGESYNPTGISDEMEAYQVAVGLQSGDERAWYIGQPNFKGGKVPGPLWALFWLAGLKTGNSPETVCLMMILLNTFVIYLVYRLAEKLLGQESSLWAALFCATTPWAVFYSGSAWNPLPMAFLGGLLYLALWNVVTKPESRHIFWVCVLLAVMPQFHMVVVFVAPVVVLVLWLSPVRLNRRWLAAGVLASILFYLPYFVGEARHDWQNTRAIFTSDLKSTPGVFKIVTLPVVGLSNLMSSTTGYDFSEYRAMGDACFGSFWILGVVNVLSLVLSVAILGNFALAFIRRFRGRWRSPRQVFAAAPSETFMGLLLLLPLLLFITSTSNFNSRYLIVQFPLLFLLPAFFLAHVRRWRNLAVATFLFLCAFNVYFNLADFRHQGRQIAQADHFIPTFHRMELVRQQLKADTGPAARIRIDDTAYRENRSRKYIFGVRQLAKYVDIREQQSSQSLPVKTYEVRAASTGNGIAFVPRQVPETH